MEIQYSLTQEDMLELNMFRIRSIPEIARRQKTLRWGYLVIMLFLTGILYLMGIPLVVCLFLVAILIGFFFYFPQYQARQLRRMIAKDFKDPERAAILEGRTAITSEDGIELATIKGKRQFAWGDFQTIEQTPQAVFGLFQDKTSFLIPRARVTGGDYDGFVTEITERSGKGRVIDLPSS